MQAQEARILQELLDRTPGLGVVDQTVVVTAVHLYKALGFASGTMKLHGHFERNQSVSLSVPEQYGSLDLLHAA